MNHSADPARFAEMFSPRVFHRMARGADSRFFESLAEHSGIVREPGQRIFDVFDHAFSRLNRPGIRGDLVYRNAIVQKRWLNTHSLNTVTVLGEQRVGSSRADLVMLNGLATGIEIKSDIDSLSRLESQIRDYSKVFPKTMVVTGPKHVTEVARLVPETTGIVELTKRNSLRTLVPAKEDYSFIDPGAVAASLRLEDARALLTLAGREIPDVPNTRAWQEVRKGLSRLEPPEVCSLYSSVLKLRRSKAQFGKYLNQLPPAVQTILLLGSFKEPEWINISSAMARGLEEL